jgi:hypothetical protein
MPHTLTLNDFIQCGVEDVLDTYRDNYDEIIRAHQLGEEYERYEEMSNEVLNQNKYYAGFSQCHFFEDLSLETVIYFIDTICHMEDLVLDSDDIAEIRGTYSGVGQFIYAVIDVLAHRYCKRHFKKILAECMEDDDVIDRMREIENEEVEKQKGVHSKLNDDVLSVISSFIA